MKFKFLTDVGKERLRRAGAALLEQGHDVDVRFKVFKLAPSNWRAWQGSESTDGDDYADTMELFVDPLVDGWQDQDVLFEVILKEGFELNAVAEKVKAAKKNTVWRVTDWSKNQTALICLDAKLEPASIKALDLDRDDRFICRDVALTNTQAANLAMQCRLKVI